MTWAKLSDDFTDDCWALSDGAFRLHVEGLVWSNRKLLDLVIPKEDLPRLSRRPGSVDELVGVGWWTEEGDAYVIRHHATYQRTREQVLQQQEVNRQNGGKGGRPAKPKRPSKTDPVSESESDSVSEPQTEIETEPDRTGLAIRAGTGEAVDGAASLLPMRPGETDEEYESRFDEWEAARAMGGEADVDEYDQAFSAKAG